MSTPISQLPPGQPIANDPELVQHILKEANAQQLHQIEQPQQIFKHSSYFPLKQIETPEISTPQFNLLQLLKKFVLITLSFILFQLSCIKEFISEYCLNRDLNMILRSILGGLSYLLFEFIF
jgi:hypothetical protein